MTTKKSKKKEGFFSKITVDVVFFIMFLFRIIPHLISLVEYEVKDAIKSVYLILILIVIAASLIFSTWLGLQVLMIVYLQSIKVTLISSLIIIVAINFALLLMTLFSISRAKKSLYFKRTRQLINDMRKF